MGSYDAWRRSNFSDLSRANKNFKCASELSLSLSLCLPTLQVKPELQLVSKAGGPAGESLARVAYHPDAEAAINEQ
jgi:hypothetical protein